MLGIYIGEKIDIGIKVRTVMKVHDIYIVGNLALQRVPRVNRQNLGKRASRTRSSE
jgi:hypothetical protein